MIGIRMGTIGLANQAPLSTVVLSSSGAEFTVRNLVLNSQLVPFIVNADVLDSDGNAFTIFT